MAMTNPDSQCNFRRAWRMLVLLLSVCCSLPFAEAQSDMINTKHNLSVSGPGAIRALTETRICVFCHTPHNASPLSPLWNKELEPQVYSVYTSATLKAGPLPQPYGPTKLCLSCHDGTIAMGTVVNPAGGIGMAGSDRLPPGSLSDFGLALSSHHPASFSYQSSLPNGELASTPPSHLTFGGADEVHCSTCHDPHNDRYGKFLAMDNRYSALCTSCHQMNGWNTSAHATSTASVSGILPRPPKTWPEWTQLNEWGCEVCHTPHFAATPEKLLNFTSTPPEFSCTTGGCHSSEPPPVHGPALSTGTSRPSALFVTGGMADIAGRMRKVSGHRSQPAPAIAGSSRGSQLFSPVNVTCADCHNPHALNNRKNEAPFVSGLLQDVRGVDRNGADVFPATYEYELCFKCHGDYNPNFAYIPRVIDSTNTRLDFDPDNPSYHPVVATGRNLNIPSIPSEFEPDMRPTDFLYCTSCHADDDASVQGGPHGSSYAPILRKRYDTADHVPESYENYALCYQCHSRSSILSDRSFRTKASGTTGSRGGHSGHLAAGVPCASCHDPHGVSTALPGDQQETGSHTHLINFDVRFVLPKPGTSYPVFRDTGSFSGTCTLLCHGFLHDNTSYP